MLHATTAGVVEKNDHVMTKVADWNEPATERMARWPRLRVEGWRTH